MSLVPGNRSLRQAQKKAVQPKPVQTIAVMTTAGTTHHEPHTKAGKSIYGLRFDEEGRPTGVQITIPDNIERGTLQELTSNPLLNEKLFYFSHDPDPKIRCVLLLGGTVRVPGEIQDSHLFICFQTGVRCSSQNRLHIQYDGQFLAGSVLLFRAIKCPHHPEAAFDWVLKDLPTSSYEQPFMKELMGGKMERLKKKTPLEGVLIG